MAQLIGGIVLILVVGIGGFLYRNILERNAIPQPEVTVCTLEAKLCPDGSAVGRSGPECAFTACAFPNIELPIGAAFVLPLGYSLNPDAIGQDDTLIAAYEKSAVSNPAHAIVIRQFLLSEGESAEDIMLGETMYEPSGMTPDSIAEFDLVTIGGKTFYARTLERFEAQVHTVYYLPRATDVLRFEILERNVTGWTDPNLEISTLPEHTALREMLGTLQVQ